MKTMSKGIILCFSLLGSMQLYAANEITITGRVIDSTCTLTGTTGTNTGSNNIGVLLDTVPASSFTGLNSTLATKPFSLQLTQSNGTAPCDSVSIAGLKGISLSVASSGYINSSTLLNTAYTGPNNRVNLQVLTDNDIPVTFDTTYPNQPKSAVSSTGLITYKARYILSATTAIAQDVQGKVTYVLEYN